MTDTRLVIETDNEGGITAGKIEGGEFGVTFDGAATYRLPLWVPPGRCGMQPSLALAYNSRAGNGSAGVGWSLIGIPQITRCKRTIADDGSAGPILFDQTDQFSLDGQRLVLASGTHGSDGAEYRTKQDTFTKIILHDVDSAPDGHVLGPTWFEAFYKDGRIFTFGGLGGSDLGSRFEGLANHFEPIVTAPTSSDNTVRDAVNVVQRSVRYGWSLSSVRDRYGNELRIYYDGYPASGMVAVERDYLPVRIVYTGSPVDASSAALRTVEFIWEDRPDPQIKFMTGLRLVQRKRLREIRMSGPDPVVPDLLRRYVLGYRNDSVSGRSLLSDVTEFDGFGIAKGSHTFTWELGQAGYDEIDTGITDIKSTPVGLSPLPGRIRVADFNADGRDDILYVPVQDPDHFYILLSDSSSPTGFAPPFKTGIPVPRDASAGRPFIFPDAVSDYMNILVRDDTAPPGTTGSPTYRVYHAGIDHSGASGSLGSFWVFRGRSIFDPTGSVEGIVEMADFDGDGLADILHADIAHAIPSWSMRTNLGGNLNFANEQFIGLFPIDHGLVSLDGEAATSILIAGPGSDPRYSAVRLSRSGPTVSSAVSLTTLLQDQTYVFADVNGTGLPSAFTLGLTNRTDPSLAENVGGEFATPIPFVLNQPPQDSPYSPLVRLMDWDQDGDSELILRTRTPAHDLDPQHSDLLVVLKWTGRGFTQTTLPFENIWRSQEDFGLFEVLDINGDGLDDFVMFSGPTGNRQLRLFVRQGMRADMMTGVVDGRGLRISITYAPLSNPSVHTRGFGWTYPQRAVSSKVWVVAEHRDDDGISGVNTYRLQYQGGVQDITGVGFLGFQTRDVLHVETGITTHTTYAPDVASYPSPGGHFYPYLGRPFQEVTHIPLDSTTEHVTTRSWMYALRPGSGPGAYFVFPETIVEENIDKRGSAPPLLRRVRTIKQDMDLYGNATLYSDTWNDGNAVSSSSTYLNDPGQWLIGLVSTVTEHSTTPTGVSQTRTRAYEYDTQGWLLREITEPGAKTSTGYLPLGPQPDGVKTSYRSIDRYPDGNLYRVIEEERMDPIGAKRSQTYMYDDIEHMFAVEIDDALGHHVKTTYHPGLGVATTLEDENGVRRMHQFDGFGKLRHEASPDGNHTTLHYQNVAGKLRVSAEHSAGTVVLSDYDALGRLTTETTYSRDDGQGAVKETGYDNLGRIVRVSRPFFVGAPTVYDRFAYDALGRQTSRVGPDGTSSTTVYRGDWILVTDGNRQTAQRVDCLNRVVFSVDRDAALVASGGTAAGMAYEYGPFDTLRVVTDIAGNSVHMISDRLGRLIDLQDPDLGHRRYHYNPFGQLEEEIKANGQKTTYHYDSVGRLYWVQDPVDGDVTYTWDTAPNGIGKLSRITIANVGAETAYTYDPAGRVTTKTWTVAADTYEITTTFDPTGRVARITYPRVGALKPFGVDYGYGNFGQLLHVTDSSTHLAFWRFQSSDATGLFVQSELGNALVESAIEDPARPGVLLSIETADSAGNLVRDLWYGFDSNLNLQSRVDKILGTTEKFEYDKLNRLHRWTWNGAAGTRRVRWDYDDIGNLRMRAVEDGPGSNLAYHYDPTIAGPHAVISTTRGAHSYKYSYNKNGNQVAATPGRTIAYGRKELPTLITSTSSSVNYISFIYDGELSRIRTIDNGARTIIDTIGGLYEFSRRTGTKSPTGKHTFVVQVNERPVARKTWTISAGKKRNDRVNYLHGDHQGSIDLITHASGKVAERLKYEPFGLRVNPSDPASAAIVPRTNVPTGYTGHAHVDAWELIDMKGRFYDPSIGKFLEPDPLVPNRYDPQAWNRYAYVLNNPLTLRDPTGFQEDSDIPQPNETVWAPGITTLEGCLADPACTDAHVMNAPGRDTPTPPPTQPSNNDDGFGGPGAVAMPTNVGSLGTTQGEGQNLSALDLQAGAAVWGVSYATITTKSVTDRPFFSHPAVYENRGTIVVGALSALTIGTFGLPLLFALGEYVLGLFSSAPALAPTASAAPSVGAALNALRGIAPESRVGWFQAWAQSFNVASGYSWLATISNLPGGGAVFLGRSGLAVVINSVGQVFRGEYPAHFLLNLASGYTPLIPDYQYLTQIIP